MRALILTFLFVAIAATSASADEPEYAGDIWLSSEATGVNPYLEYTQYIPSDIYVRVGASRPLRSVRFALPFAACVDTVLLASASSPYSVEGSIESGVTIDFGECIEPTGTVMAIGLFILMTADCCEWAFEPHPDAASGRIEAVDCDGNTVYLFPHGGTFDMDFGIDDCGAPTVPSYPFPADGAVDVPLTVDLDWLSQTTAGTNLGVFIANVYFGTTPDAPVLLWNVDADAAHVVGPLEPNTTFYWKVHSIAGDFGDTFGPVWSFTTTNGVAAETSTWGRIKALHK
jgi:hypothetical protein